MSERIKDIGEFALIGRIHDLLKQEGLRSERVTMGIGDDTASFLPRPGYELLVTCDSLVEGRHYLPGQISPLDLGRRAMTVNISDIGAMGGHPLYALISLGLNPDRLIRDVMEIYRGFLLELNLFGASIIGGNLTRSGNGLFIDITLIGEVEQGKSLRRSGARAGDVILVTGFPGQAAAGLKLLLRSPNAPDLLKHPLVRIYNTPSHRARLGAAIAQAGLASAMIDTSDGLLGDLGHICVESNVGALLVKEKLPISDPLREAAVTLGLDPYDLFLGDSDDYELLVTCRMEDVALLSSLATRSGLSVPLTEVGRITSEAPGIFMILRDGSRHPVRSLGWDHFRLG
jgi:thiamine-monophosphate kinase